MPQVSSTTNIQYYIYRINYDIQWHAGYTFAIRDLNTSIKLKLISTKRLINTTLGKVSIPLETIYDAPKVVELALEVRQITHVS